MAYSAPPARTEISDTYPNPSNAVARVGFGKLWDYVTGLLGSTGNPTAAKAALLIPVDVDFTNRIINGAMLIDQRNNGASVAVTATNTFVVDRFYAYGSQSSKLTAQQNAGSVAPPVGFSKYLGFTSLSAYSVLAADIFYTAQKIEGFNTADLAWGTTNAKTVTLSFQVYSSLTGTFGGSINNEGSNYCYPFTYSIPVANTWTTISVTIAGPTSGTWVGATNGIGLYVSFGLGVGSTSSGTAGAWASGTYFSATGATSVVGTSGATFYITGVQLEKGTAATGFATRPYGTELALCQRYFFIVTGGGRHAIAGNGSVSQSFPTVFLPVTMRASPTLGYSSLAHFNSEGITGGGTSVATSISINTSTTQSVTYQVLTSGSATGTGAQLLGNSGGGNSWTSLSAEL